MEQTFTQAIAAIAADNQSGAAQIAERAADLLLQHASLGQTSSPDAFRHEILTVGWALIRAQAVMAPLVNLVNAVLWRMEQSDSPSGQRQAVAQATGEFKRQMHLHALNVAEGALGLIGEGSRVITLSFSSTIQHALIHAQRAGRHLEVLCAESLPGREGRATVDLLRTCGITITLLSDQEARQATAQADVVLVGADMLTNRGLVNKYGTFAMALAARAAGTPLYTLCGSEKFLPPGFQLLDGANTLNEIPWPHSGHEGRLGDLPYDFTPLELIAGIVTEQAILPVATVEAWLAATRLHPSLTQRSVAAVA